MSQKWLVTKRYEWASKYHPDEWFDFRVEALAYIALEQKRDATISFRLMPIQHDGCDPEVHPGVPKPTKGQVPDPVEAELSVQTRKLEAALDTD